MGNYKKLPRFMETFSKVPPFAIWCFNRYCEYGYIDIDGYGEIPLQKIALDGIMWNNIGKFGITKDNYNKSIVSDVLPDLKEYAKGFLKGYNVKFDTFINTIEAQKEIVIRAALKNHQSIEEKHGYSDELEYLLYDAGLYEGERYRAWVIILQTPNEFSLYFVNDEQKNKKSQRTIKESEIRKLFKQKLNTRKMVGTNLSEADIIISNLKIDRKSNIDYAKIASIFFNSKYVEHKQEHFKDFLTMFYNLVGIDNGTDYKEHRLHSLKALQAEFQYLY